MTKPQPWYAAFNQPPRSAKKHGRNWKSSPQAHGNPADRADPAVDSGADDTFAAWVTWNAGSVSIFPYPEPNRPEPIPYAGVRAGEIIGHRMWLVLDEGLCSLAHHFIWEPGATIEGNINERVGASFANFIRPIYGGVYSFDSYERLMQKESRDFDPTKLPTIISFDHFGFNRFKLNAIAIGTVKCWGEVIEHEEGWRAQYAKLHSIDHIVGRADINALRERYKV